MLAEADRLDLDGVQHEPDLRTVAVLYCDPRGSYADAPGVELWDEARDARLYDGPHPVVAHPPCARWSRLAGFCETQYGLKRGDDGGCFAAALAAVREFGGVLEHPAYSAAWDDFGLPDPTWHRGWTTSLLDGGHSAYVEQWRYGRKVKKATWLYAYGVELPELAWGYLADRDAAFPFKWSARRHFTDTGSPSLPRADRIRTPEAFRDTLLAMARSAVPIDTQLHHAD